jgi:hypothetical protein
MAFHGIWCVRVGRCDVMCQSVMMGLTGPLFLRDEAAVVITVMNGIELALR